MPGNNTQWSVGVLEYPPAKVLYGGQVGALILKTKKRRFELSGSSPD